MDKSRNDGGEKKRKSPSFDKLIQKVSKNQYKVPSSLLEMLNEHTTGYILISLDNHGSISYHQRFDHDLIAESTEYKALQILQARRDAYDRSIFDQVNPPDDDGESGENVE